MADVQHGLSRRTVAKGAAWAAPAIAVAATAPRVAASPIVTVTQAGAACKLPGESCSDAGYSKGYLQPLTICNNSRTSITVTITTPAYLTIAGRRERFVPIPARFTLDTGGCQRVDLNLNLQDNSRNSSIAGTLGWTYVAADGRTGSGSTGISTSVSPPCDNCTPTLADGERIEAASASTEVAPEVTPTPSPSAPAAPRATAATEPTATPTPSATPRT